MATHTNSGNAFPGRTFSISRENGQNDKNGRPYFFEWLQVIPEEKGSRKFESRPSSTGTRHYELFAALDGVLTGFEIESKSFGESKPAENWLVLYMQDGDEQYKIQCGSLDGRYSIDVMKRLLDPAFVPELKLRLSPFAMEKTGGGWNIGMAAHSGVDGKLVANWEAAHLEGMPQAESREWKGQTEWDYSNVAQWLYAQLQARVLPILNGWSVEAPAAINTKVTASASASTFPAEASKNPAVSAGIPKAEPVGSSDDLPF